MNIGSQGGTRTRTEESPTDFKSVAAAITPLGHKKVGPEGFEPPTKRL